MENIIEVKNLEKVTKQKVVKGISFDVKQGEILGF